MTIERHVELGAWKQARHAAPERRALMGETLLARYVEADQDPAVAARNRENERRRQLQEEYRAAFRAANPAAKQVRLPKEQKEASDWSQEGLRVRLRLETAALDSDLEELLALFTFEAGSRWVLYRRWTVDEAGTRRTVWQGDDPTATPGVFEVPFAATGYRVAKVRVVLDTDRRPGWNEIDAVELVGPEGRAWAATATASSIYGQP